MEVMTGLEIDYDCDIAVSKHSYYINTNPMCCMQMVVWLIICWLVRWLVGYEVSIIGFIPWLLDLLVG